VVLFVVVFYVCEVGLIYREAVVEFCGGGVFFVVLFGPCEEVGFECGCEC